MPYVVNDGQQVDAGAKVYKSGAFVPGEKGALDDMVEAGVVRWEEAPPREPRPKPRRKAVK